MRELRNESKKNAEAKLKAYGGEAGYKKGGKVKHSDEKEDMDLMHSELKPSAFKPHKADGGPIDGGMPKMALGRSRKGGKPHGKGKGTNVNVIVAPKPDASPAMPPLSAPIAAGPRPLPPVGGSPMPPAGAMPPKPIAAGPGPSPMAGAMNRGGKVKRAHGGKVGHYDAGAGSGLGREEKIERYGKKAMRG